METIKETIQNVIQALEDKNKQAAQDNPEAFLEKAFSKKEKAHIKFNYFRGGTLSIRVDSSVWLYHFSLKKDGLLTRLHKKSNKINTIHFCLGETK
jgi:hypothetical protein